MLNTPVLGKLEIWPSVCSAMYSTKIRLCNLYLEDLINTLISLPIHQQYFQRKEENAEHKLKSSRAAHQTKSHMGVIGMTG